MFPIGNLDKPKVRKIAQEQQLANADRKDSQGICFIGKVDLPTFLQQQLEARPGRVIEIPESSNMGRKSHPEDLATLAAPYPFDPEMGESIGEHRGAHFFTVGQRKGLNIGGKPEPLFVIGTDVKENLVYVGQGKDHPLLFKKALFIRSQDMHWIREDLALSTGQSADYLVRIRYRQHLQKARLFIESDGCFVVFEDPQRAVVSGQFAAFYLEDELIGSGVIHF